MKVKMDKVYLPKLYNNISLTRNPEGVLIVRAKYRHGNYKYKDDYLYNDVVRVPQKIGKHIAYMIPYRNE